MVHGAWCMVHGAWCMVHGAWCMVHGGMVAMVLVTVTTARLKGSEGGGDML